MSKIPARGPKGKKGSIGPVGPPGERGRQGERGSIGADGERGDQGIPGIQGVPGPRGEQGVPGTFGPMGPQGNPGLSGGQGRQGVQGVEGPIGLKGPPGTGISQYLLSLEDTLYPLIEVNENEVELDIEQIDETFSLNFITNKEFYYIQFLIYDSNSVIFYHREVSNKMIITNELSSYLIHITIKWK